MQWSSDGFPFQTTVLFYDPHSGKYSLSLFSRSCDKGFVQNVEELKLVITKSFENTMPCFGIPKHFETDPVFSFKCLKVVESGLHCDQCQIETDQVQQDFMKVSNSIKLEDKTDLLLENTIESNDTFKREDDIKTDILIEDLLERHMEEEPVSLKLEFSKHTCLFCQKTFENLEPLGNHLLKAHAQEPDILKIWFELDITPRTKFNCLDALKKKNQRED